MTLVGFSKKTKESSRSAKPSSKSDSCPHGVSAAYAVKKAAAPEPIHRLRRLREEARQRHAIQSAIFWADKLTTMTDGDKDDVYALCQLYFEDGQYQRAIHILNGHTRDYERSLRYQWLTAECLIKLNQWQEALDLLDSVELSTSVKDTIDEVGGVKVDALLAMTRGKIYQNEHKFLQAATAYRQAFLADCRCVEAFNALLAARVFSAEEELQMLDQLTLVPNDLLLALYRTKLQTQSSSEHELQRWNLARNSDALSQEAASLYYEGHIEACYQLATAVLEQDAFELQILPYYIGCLYELQLQTKLFMLSHQLMANYPQRAVSWYSIGVYYLLLGKNATARKYLSKATTFDSRFAPAWVAFGHAFAFDKEHDQAVSAYATVMRLFPGHFMPPLYLAMQHARIHQLPLALDLIQTSLTINPKDPLSWNERGLIYYHQNEIEESKKCFERALEISKELNYDVDFQEPVLVNLGHVFRQLGVIDTAAVCFLEALRLAPNQACTCKALAFVYQLANKLDAAIEYYHRALILKPQDPFATEMLDRTMKEALSVQQDIFWRKIPDVVDFSSDGQESPVDVTPSFKQESVEMTAPRITRRSARALQRQRKQSSEAEEEDDIDNQMDLMEL